MGKNDTILIDGIIDERVELKLPSDKRDEVFEYFAFEQILKDYDLSKEEIEFGIVDGKNDGGIDGFYIFVNGHLISDIEKHNWPKTGCLLEVSIITCKHHDTFKQAPLDNIVASISELFDFSLEDLNLKGDYSEAILSQKNILKNTYRKVSPRLTHFKINYYYASRGNSIDLGDSIIARGNQIIKITSDFFGNSIANFQYVGAQELIELSRKKPNFSLELPFIDDLSSGETYIILVKLIDFYNFISDNGKLRRYLFDSNVRDFMGLNRVNEDIKKTLYNDNSPDFWWLNNGVTILATGASVVGKSIQIQDIQIVNGLQTSESIYRYFNDNGLDINNRSVLVKVIVSNSPKDRDEIIRATNNQTTVELSALHATDKIQRDIEEVLKLSDYYYERRTNFYRNLDIPTERIVTPLYMASGYVNLILKQPEQASVLRSKFMRVESSYNKVFSTKVDLEIWPKIAEILLTTDIFIESKRPKDNGNGEHFLKNRRQYISFLAVSYLLKSFNFSVTDLIKLDLKGYNAEVLEICWNLVTNLIPVQFTKTKLKRNNFIVVCERMSQEHSVNGIERIKKDINAKKFNELNIDKTLRKEFNLSELFLQRVDELLPIQPWKPNMHLNLLKELLCTEKELNSAIKQLIKSGKRYRQKDGIVYDSENQVLKIDEERVDKETLLLKTNTAHN